MAQSRHEKSYLFIIGILIILIALAVILFFALQTDTVAVQLEKNDQLLTVLFVLHKDEVPLFTNVLIYYPKTEQCALFSIPGDTGLILSSLDRVDRIDAVYREKGIETYKNEIEKLTGTTIPFTIEISVEQFSVLTDLLGGMNVFIPSPIDVVNDGTRHILPSGSVDLDGEKMVSYMSYVDTEETADNVQERMESIMVAFLHSLNKKSSVVLNKNVFPIVSRNMKANIDKKALYKLVSFVSAIDSERLNPQTITGTRRIVDGQSLIFPEYNGDEIKKVVNQAKLRLASSSGNAYERVYALEVLNGTTRQGLARKTGLMLQNYGYNIENMSNAETQDYDKTVIIDHIGNDKVAQSLADIIRCKNIVKEDAASYAGSENDEAKYDFTIILGRDFDGRYVQ